MKKRVAVLISGFGSNLQALIDACKNENFPAKICLVISNKQDAFGLQRAEKEKIKNLFIDSKAFKTRTEFEQKVNEHLQAHNIQIICLAGFMRLLSDFFINTWAGKIINIHPSLLPAFKGVDAIKQAFDYKVKITGVTVHVVTKEMDSGPIIMQQAVRINKTDTLQTLEEKIHQTEHKLYPKALKAFCKKTK
jgi:phosphoribosylglycinamide formyltransferase-1